MEKIPNKKLKELVERIMYDLGDKKIVETVKEDERAIRVLEGCFTDKLTIDETMRKAVKENIMPEQLLRCCAAFVSGMRAQEDINEIDYLEAGKDLYDALTKLSEKYNDLITEYNIDDYELIKRRNLINLTRFTKSSEQEVKEILTEAGLYYEAFRSGLNAGIEYSEW